MADAPAGGGGGISGVEIILLVVLAIGALSVLSGKPLSAPSIAPTETATPAPTATCSIALTSPTKLQKISQYVTVSGSLANCDPSSLANRMPSLQGISLNVQVVDKNGSPMSAYTPVPLGVLTSQSSGTFNATLPITGSPAAGTGYVIVIGPTQANGAQYTARMPITF